MPTFCKNNKVLIVTMTQYNLISQSNFRNLTRSSGARRKILEIGCRCCAEKIAHASWIANAFAGRSGIQTDLFRGPAFARWRLSSRHGLGVADRAVCRCLAENACARPKLGPQVSRAFPRTSERSWCRDHQRSIRCARTAPPRRLHRPGLECRGNPARLDKNGVSCDRRSWLRWQPFAVSVRFSR